MYKCSKCKKVFEYFEIENGVCPHCGKTDIYEIGTCDGCEKKQKHLKILIMVDFLVGCVATALRKVYRIVR